MTHKETLVAEQLLTVKPVFEKTVKSSIIFTALTIALILVSAPLFS